MPAPRKDIVRFQERAELLDFLLDIADATSESLDLDRILANVAGRIRKVIPYDLFAIFLQNEKQCGMRIRYSIGHRDEVVRGLLIKLGEGITGEAAATRLPVLVGDVRNDPRYLATVDAVRTEMAVPMIAGGKLVGVIDLQSTRVHAYKEQDRALLTLIAGRVAVATVNARLYRRVDRQARTLKTLASLSQEFSSILPLDELLGKIATTVHGLITFDGFSILLVDPDKRVLRHRFSERFDERIRIDMIPLGKGITGAAATARKTIRVDDTLSDPRFIASHPDIRSEIAVPLIVQDRVVGVMDLESDRIRYFTEDHARLLGLLAPQIASSIENARLYEELESREQRMQQDLQAARKLQSILLPLIAPETEGLDIAIRLRPAREISGDIYDIFQHGPEYAVFAFGDVSGKGAAAALYGALVSGLLRTLAHRRRGPAELLKLVNDVLLERRVDAQYVTLTVLLWESVHCRLTIANAGAIPPLICHLGEITKPKLEGVPAGLLDDREYDEAVFEMTPGDVVLLYSDGIQDQGNANEQEYGRVRLQRVLKRTWQMGVEEIADEVLKDLDEFTDGAPAFDDQTLIVMKVR